jgi:hypothetical protein
MLARGLDMRHALRGATRPARRAMGPGSRYARLKAGYSTGDTRHGHRVSIRPLEGGLLDRRRRARATGQQLPSWRGSGSEPISVFSVSLW